MALCGAAVLILAVAADDSIVGGGFGLVAFALFGAGLGVFLAPNNHAAMSAAPAHLSGEAGALLNLMRILGTSLGVASASSMLSWRLQRTTGTHDHWLLFAGHPLTGAVESSLALLAVFAAIAAAASLLRPGAAQSAA
jgi:hypothetical protein